MSYCAGVSVVQSLNSTRCTGALIPVGLGVAVSIVGLSKLITGLMTDTPGPTYAFFFGLILASAWIPLARMKTKALVHLFVLASTAVLAWLVVGLQPDGTAFQVANQSKEATTVFYAGKLRQPADILTMKTLRMQKLLVCPLPFSIPKAFSRPKGVSRLQSTSRDKSSPIKPLSTNGLRVSQSLWSSKKHGPRCGGFSYADSSPSRPWCSRA